MTGHFPRLDGLRALAVLAVAVYHWFHPTLWGRPLPLGEMGVSLFFVLSGYLIGGILVDAQARNHAEGARPWFTLRAFAIRRALRIFPAYFVFLALTAAILGLPDPEWYWYPLYLSNVHIETLSAWPEYWSHTWSLAVEEQFYLVIPLVVLFSGRRRLAGVLGLSVVVAGAAAAKLGTVGGWLGSDLGLIPPASFYGLLIGVVLALAVRCLPHVFELVAGLGVVAGIGWMAAWWWSFEGSHVLAILGWPLLCAAVVLWATTDGVAGGFLELSPMLWIGRLAYGIYLWHMPAPRLLEEIGVGAPDNDVAAFVLLASCSVLAAKLSWDLVEKPINDVKSRYPYHPRSCDPAPGSIDATVDTDPVRLS